VPRRLRIPVLVDDLSNLAGRLLVIFDGSCGFCNRTVRWFLCRDHGDRLRFVASDSPKIAPLVERLRPSLNSEPGTLSALVVIRDPMGPSEKIFFGSDATEVLLAKLPPPWPWLARLLGSIPRPIRDLGYAIVARHRYRIRGRLTNCPLPAPEERRHFL
jgi:predicted DCC family thiol-disulfide oxidoreductase YuxK